MITLVLTGSLAFEVVAVAGRLTSCIFSALGFGMVEAVAGRSWGRVAPVVADPSAFAVPALLLVPFEAPYVCQRYFSYAVPAFPNVPTVWIVVPAPCHA